VIRLGRGEETDLFGRLWGEDERERTRIGRSYRHVISSDFVLFFSGRESARLSRLVRWTVAVGLLNMAWGYLGGWQLGT
jgi:hypothetical protein